MGVSFKMTVLGSLLDAGRTSVNAWSEPFGVLAPHRLVAKNTALFSWTGRTTVPFLMPAAWIMRIWNPGLSAP